MCICPPQFTGYNCDQSVAATTVRPATTAINPFNPCSSSPCLMGGTCIPIPQTNINPPYACVCQPAYTGTRCELLSALNPTSTAASVTTTRNYCSPNPCSSGSTCISIHEPNVQPPYACICPPNFTGLTCSTPINANPNACASSPCINGGTCRSISDPNVQPPFACICPPAYSGLRCETFISQSSACNPNPCTNGGTCSTNPYTGGFTCTCAARFTGPKCTDVIYPPNPCNNNPCASGSTCQATASGTFSCICPPNRTGQTCTEQISYNPTTPSTSACSSGPCLNGATCIPYSLGYQCQCVTGYVGARCETRMFINLCNANTCYNGGTCETQSKVQDEYTVVCFCRPGFTGSRCQTSTSSLTTTAANPVTCPCLNNGQCRSDGTCACQNGYYGNRCEYYSNPTTAATTPNPCPTGLCINGYCQLGPQAGTSYCICNIGWTGPRCNVRNYCQSPQAVCQNGGTCVNNLNGYSCACRAGFSGSNCQDGTGSQPGYINQQGTCNAGCLNGGSCYFSNNVPTCLCQRGYIGLKCEVDVCQQKPIVGVCLGSFQRFYYNPLLKQCQPFIYSGCRGNENNFDSFEECNRRCSGH